MTDRAPNEPDCWQVRQSILELDTASTEGRALGSEVLHMDANEALVKLTEQNALMKSLLTFMPAMVFSKDAETGVYLSCNQSFAEYAHRASPEDVVGLTDFQIFDEVTAAHFVEDDQKALVMDAPHIF
ncbi:MAG: hypothetical protein IJ769_01605, partial [Clostridia bacterium]|nr:hypothetical protein [Clostridia bacterium]